MTDEQRRLYSIDTPDELPDGMSWHDAPEDMRLGAGAVLVFAVALAVGIAGAAYALAWLIGAA